MNHRRPPQVLLSLGLFVAAAAPAHAQQQDPMRRYDELVAEARRAIGARDEVLTAARAEMRSANGTLSSELASELTHREELVEIAESRLVAFCQMHSLRVPDLSAAADDDAADTTTAEPTGDDPLRDSFSRALRVVRASFASEARRVAARVRLPAFRRSDAAEERS